MHIYIGYCDPIFVHPNVSNLANSECRLEAFSCHSIGKLDIAWCSFANATGHMVLGAPNE